MSEKNRKAEAGPFGSQGKREKMRCEYVSPTGRRCRLNAVSEDSGLCAAHERKMQLDENELFDEMDKAADDFKTPEGVNRVLSAIFFALMGRRITDRRAGILTYIAQTILHAQRAMARQQEVDAKQRPRQFIMDLPTAIRPGPRYDLVTGKIIEEDEPEPATKSTDRPASLPTSGQALRDSGQALRTSGQALRDSGQALRTSGQAEDGPYKGARENQKAPDSVGGGYKTAA